MCTFLPAHVRDRGGEVLMTQPMPKALGARSAFMYLVPVALIVFVIDQLTKIWAEDQLEIGAAPIPVIGEFIQWRLIYNPGAALSFGTSATWLLTVVSAVVAIGLIWVAPKLTTKLWVVTAALLLGGTVGNLADRLFRAPGFPEGHVVDFIDYGPFVGNVADIAIVGAAILIGTLSIFGSSPVVDPKEVASETSNLRESEGAVVENDAPEAGVAVTLDQDSADSVESKEN